MPWNLDSSRPIYLQIIERVQMDIITGRYQPGDKLPSVRDRAGGRRQPEHNAESAFRTGTQRTDLFPADQRTLYYRR